MNRLPTFALAAALSVAGTPSARTQTLPDSTNNRAAARPALPSSSPSVSGGTDKTIRIAQAGPTAELAEHRASKIIGMRVQTPTGDSLGEVKDIVVDNNGMVTHAADGDDSVLPS